jgi:hypothetical protein
MAVSQQQNGTLVASTVSTFTFTNVGSARKVLLFNNQAGAVDLWATVDGSTPTVAGTDTIYVPANAEATQTVNDGVSQSIITVKVISSGTPKVVVEVR